MYGATRSEFPRAPSMGSHKRQFLVVADLRFAFANKDDTSPPVFDHSRHDEPRQRDRSKGINLEQPPHLIRRDVQRLCRGRVGDPCVIDEDIGPTECLDRSIDNRRQVLFVAEIGCRNGRAIVTFASAWVSSSEVVSVAVRNTRWPALNKANVIARPRPRPAPVTGAARPVIWFCAKSGPPTIISSRH